MQQMGLFLLTWPRATTRAWMRNGASSMWRSREPEGTFTSMHRCATTTETRLDGRTSTATLSGLASCHRVSTGSSTIEPFGAPSTYPYPLRRSRSLAEWTSFFAGSGSASGAGCRPLRAAPRPTHDLPHVISRGPHRRSEGRHASQHLGSSVSHIVSSGPATFWLHCR